MRQTHHLKKALALCAAAAVLATQLPAVAGGLQANAEEGGEAARTPVITVDAFTERAEISPYTFGSNHRHAYGGFGMYDEENDQVYPDFLEKTKESSLGVVRYPGGTIANLFTWKDTIGPRAERSNVVLGNNYASVFPYYGLDEHMRYTEDIGAEVLYMVGEAAETPAGAADLVEYMNAPNDGSNPGGGTDWAAVRAQNGHPEPYDVIYYEIGNEMYIDSQMYWLTLPSVFGETDRAKRYALGDTVQATGSKVRVKGTWADNLSRGQAGETFYTQYNPVVEGTETVYVNGEKWTRTDDLQTARSAEQVYEFDYKTGEIRFGDGKHGVIPPQNAPVTADYQHKHAGFIEYYEAMKAVDPDIKIFSTLPFVYNFVPSDKCDGIVYHDYIGYPKNLTTPGEVHDGFMTVSDQLVQAIDKNVTDLRNKSGRNDTIPAVTEFGTLDVSRVYSEDPSNEGREEARSLSRALSFAVTFMGSSKAETLIHIQQAFTAYSFGGGPGLPGADSVYNSMYAPYPDDPTKFVEGGTALAYKLIGNNKGDTVRNSYIENNPVVKRSTEYEALRVLATQTDENGDLYLLAVNRDADNDITASVNLKGYAISGSARIQTLNAADVAACNSPDNPDAISISETETALGVGGDSFSYTFPAHSLVAIKLSGASEKPYTDNFQLRHFGSPKIGSVPNYFKVESGSGTVQSAREADPNNKAFQITREGTNARVWAPLSGQDATVENPKTYDGLLKITFLVKALQDNSRLDISVWGGGKEAFNLAFENKRIMTGSAARAVYEKDKFYKVEMVLDHKAKQFVFYLDGSYIGSASVYNSGVTAQLDYLVFDVENQKGSFLIDDLMIQSANNELTSKITQADDVRLTTEVGTAPSLPETVTVRYNTGEAEVKNVVWADVDPEKYAAPGTYTVAGTIDGVDLPARAVVNVVPAVEAIGPVQVSTLQGVEPQLPREVTVKYSDGSSAARRVTWEPIDPAKYAQAGTFTVKGAVEDVLDPATAQITVLARVNAPLITVEAFTERGEAAGIPNGKQVNAFVERSAAAADLQVDAVRTADGSLYLQAVNRNSRDSVIATVNLKGYKITGDAAVRTRQGTDEKAANIWSDPDAVEVAASLGAGGSSFAYTFPSDSTVSIKLTGEASAATPWTDNFWVRHFGSAAIGAVPSYFSLTSGDASVQKDPANSEEQVFMLKRAGTDVQVRATLSGQDFPAATPTGYNGLLRITFRLKAAQNSGRFGMRLCSGDSGLIGLYFDNGALKCNDQDLADYNAGAWYDMEILLDHKTGGYAVYMDGGCLVYQGSYDPGDAALDFALISADGGDGVFYLDDFQVKNIHTDLVPAITQIDNAYVTTAWGNAPALPETVFAGYNTGEKESRNVAWEAVEPEQYAKRGVFTVAGTVEGLSLPARAVVTVTADILSAAQVSLNTTAGVAPVLPEKVTVIYADGSTGEAAVVWDSIDPAAYAAEGVFKVAGMIAGTAVKADAAVTVAAALTISEILPIEVWTKEGQKPVLPDQVQVVYTDGTTGELPVTWDEIPPAAYEKSGGFSVSGVIAYNSLPVEAGVTVYLPGDMTGSGYINITDVMECCKVLARKALHQTPTAEESLRGDLTGEGDVTITDVMAICKILASRAM